MKNQHKIADLHCDLLCYLSRDPKRTPYDPSVRCSIPQLKLGNVKLQTMAIFTETGPDSAKSGHNQVEVFRNLPKLYPNIFELMHPGILPDDLKKSEKIFILPAIENASSFCEENENLEKALQRINDWQRKMGKFAYVSLTWNSENRFGGGAFTRIGLKEDGKRLLDYLCQKGIALDLSHASDHLAYDLLNEIDKKGFKLPVIASHSNLRALVDVPRNLPDDLAKEIVRRGGIIGMNFIRYFVGEESVDNFSRQLERFISLGASTQLCFGADFFFGDDVSPAFRKPPEVCFFPQYDNAEAYPRLLDLWRKHNVASHEILENVSYDNLVNFLCKKIYSDIK